jgi:Haem-binding domain
VKTILRLGLVAVGLLGGASGFVHPFGPVKNQLSTGPLLADAEINPAIARAFERSCQNCHSERTDWPWYSYVAPLSWFMENDVHRRRSHMNLSRWLYRRSTGRASNQIGGRGAKSPNAAPEVFTIASRSQAFGSRREATVYMGAQRTPTSEGRCQLEAKDFDRLVTWLFDDLWECPVDRRK